MGESLVYAMEYVDGSDLATLVKGKGPLPVATTTSYFVHQTALGLQHAHENGLVHRDIKPGNLMQTAQGKRRIIKILDFGLTKAVSEGRRRLADDAKPDARHARLHRSRADPRRVIRGHPHRYLQSRLYTLLSAHRTRPISSEQSLLTSYKLTSRWTPTR